MIDQIPAPSCYFISIDIKGTVNYTLDFCGKNSDVENQLHTILGPINICTVITANSKNDLDTFLSVLRLLGDIENKDDEDCLVNSNKEIFTAVIRYSHYDILYEYYTNIQLSQVVESKCYRITKEHKTLIYDMDSNQSEHILNNTFSDFVSNYLSTPIIPAPKTYTSYNKHFYNEIAEWMEDWNSDRDIIDVFLGVLYCLSPDTKLVESLDDIRIVKKDKNYTIYFHADKEYALEDFPEEFIYIIQFIRYYFCTLEVQAPLLFNNLDNYTYEFSSFKCSLLSRFIHLMTKHNTNKHQSQCLFFITNKIVVNLLTINTGVAVVKIN